MRVETAFPAAATPRSEESAKLRRHATEFEGILLTEMLGKLQKTFAATESESNAGSDAASETISGMGTQALAQALAQRNVLGIGAMVTRSLSGTATPVTAAGLHSRSEPADKAVEVQK